MYGVCLIYRKIIKRPIKIHNMYGLGVVHPKVMDLPSKKLFNGSWVAKCPFKTMKCLSDILLELTHKTTQ